ncbi:MAG: division/cell wall cluster transcriptional repressor MraZ [Bacteroidetes bacterium]|nr:division/cell wall cluster transcriptional repressor MraZ [Bacteroidota bacterium]
MVNLDKNFGFMGEYQYSLDKKGRVSLPQRLRKNLSADLDRVFIITRGFEQCLLLYPEKTWQQISAKLAEFSYIASPDNRAFIRTFLSWANELELDGQFRLNIPQRHLEFAQISEESVLLGLMDKIELWNPVRYREYQAKMGADYETIAGKIMGL